jgi:hypothetical protein
LHQKWQAGKEIKDNLLKKSWTAAPPNTSGEILQSFSTATDSKLNIDNFFNHCNPLLYHCNHLLHHCLPIKLSKSFIRSPTHPFRLSQNLLIFIISIKWLSPKYYLRIYKVHFLNMFINVWERERERERERETPPEDKWARDSDSGVHVFCSCFKDIMATPFLGNV